LSKSFILSFAAEPGGGDEDFSAKYFCQLFAVPFYFASLHCIMLELVAIVKVKLINSYNIEKHLLVLKISHQNTLASTA
jgi:hypothetical protein